MIFEDIYGFILGKNILLDRLYMIVFVSTPFSWIICKDECIVSYLMKKLENKQYIIGNEPENAKDIIDLFKNEQQYLIFYNLHNLLRMFSVSIVNKRTTTIHDLFFIPTCIFYLCYNYDITYRINYRKKVYPYFQIIFSLYLFTCFYKILTL